MLRYFLYLCLLLLSTEAQAQYDNIYSKYQRLSFDAQYFTFSDILNNATNESITLDPMINVNLNFRFYRTYSLILSHGESSVWSYNGVGLRIDLPGVFFLGGSTSDFIRKSKRKNWNSYFQVSKLLTQAEGEPEEFVCDKTGFGLDAFITGGVYINVELNFFSYKGNQFLAPGVGLGFEF